MARFTLVYYETVKISRDMEAATVEEAIEEAEDLEGWEDCDEETVGTVGVEVAYDEEGKVVWGKDREESE